MSANEKELKLNNVDEKVGAIPVETVAVSATKEAISSEPAKEKKTTKTAVKKTTKTPAKSTKAKKEAEEVNETEEKVEAKTTKAKKAAVKEETPAKKTTAAKTTKTMKAAPKKTSTSTAAKKATAVKSSTPAVSICIQFAEKELTQEDMVERIKKEWEKSGKKVSDIRSIDTYVKITENKIYYVINGEPTGSIDM